MKLLFFIAFLIGFLIASMGLRHIADETRLVGYGCPGTDGPIYRAAEDQFPAGCADIHPSI